MRDCHSGREHAGRGRHGRGFDRMRDFGDEMREFARGRMHGMRGMFAEAAEEFGFGRFGGPRPGRVLGHGDLRLLLLAMIGEKPRHGYDLIRAIEERFAGGYAPSPGAVYPTLTMLEEQDLIRAEASQGSKKLFSITPEGEAFLKENAAAIDGIMSRIDLAAAAFASHATPETVREAVKTLRHALHMRRTPWTQADADRIKAIIEKAARDIVGNAED